MSSKKPFLLPMTFRKYPKSLQTIKRDYLNLKHDIIPEFHWLRAQLCGKKAS